MDISKKDLENIFDIKIVELIYDETGFYIKKKNKDYYQKLELSSKKYKINEFDIMKETK